VTSDGSVSVMVSVGIVESCFFLAFPAIFPAGATLVQKHEVEKKRRAGITDRDRGRKATALEARGACMGSIGLVAFAMVAWKLLMRQNAALSLLAALAVWVVLSILFWRASKFNFGKRGRGRLLTRFHSHWSRFYVASKTLRTSTPLGLRCFPVG